MDFQPTPPVGSPLTPAGEKKSAMLWVLLVIAAVLVALILWVWFYGGGLLPSKEEAVNYYPNIIKPPTEPYVSALENQSSSDDVSAIENDLNATNLQNLDLELNAVDKELAQ